MKILPTDTVLNYGSCISDQLELNMKSDLTLYNKTFPESYNKFLANQTSAEHSHIDNL